MARIDNVTNFLTDVADSIRTKTGKTEPILASEFDTEIESIAGEEDLEAELTVYDEELTEQEDTLATILNVLESKNNGGGGEEMIKYSTEEQVIGEWIDGKPIYRKVLVCADALTGGSNYIAHNIENYNVTIDAKMFIAFSSTTYVNHCFESSTKFVGINSVGNTSVNITVGSDWANSFTSGFVIVLEYTKTTD